MANHSTTFKVEYLDYTNLPDNNVKVAYLHKNYGKRIIKDDIKIVHSKLTENTRSRQQEFNFVEFPKARWTYLIYADGTYF